MRHKIQLHELNIKKIFEQNNIHCENKNITDTGCKNNRLNEYKNKALEPELQKICFDILKAS